jgi:hypothetical protein
LSRAHRALGKRKKGAIWDSCLDRGGIEGIHKVSEEEEKAEAIYRQLLMFTGSGEPFGCSFC